MFRTCMVCLVRYEPIKWNHFTALTFSYVYAPTLSMSPEKRSNCLIVHIIVKLVDS